MKKLLICLLLIAPNCWAAWTHNHVVDNAACNSGTTCAVTLGYTTSAGHLLVAGIISDSSATISSVTAGACTSSWTHAPSTNTGSATDAYIDLYYCLNSASGQTSITITVSGSYSSGAGMIWDATPDTGYTIAIDSGATPSGSKFDNTACTSCAGTSLTLSGNNDYIVALAGCGNACSGLTGTGWVNDLSNPSNSGAAHAITSGSQTAPATWTQASATLYGNAVAIQETAPGAAHTRPPAIF